MSTAPRFTLLASRAVCYGLPDLLAAGLRPERAAGRWPPPWIPYACSAAITQSAAQKPLVRAEPQELPAVGVVYWMPMR